MANQDKILVARERAQFVFRRKFGDLSPVAVAGRMPENVKSEIFLGRGYFSKREAHVVNVAPCQKLRAEPSYWERLSGELWNATFRTTLGLPRGTVRECGRGRAASTLSRSSGLSDQMRMWMRVLTCVCVCVCTLPRAHLELICHTHAHTHTAIYL